jgi:nucleotide-binding universal stress UspA family protein
MKTEKRILFPVDFSEHCERVAREIFSLARRLEAEVVVMHALDLPPASNSEWLSSVEALDPEKLQVLAAKRLERFVHEESRGAAVKLRIESGHPAVEILTCASREEVDFIAMPTRGLGPFTSYLFGSVAEQVLHQAQCPVWTEGRRTEAVTRYEDILCAVDLSSGTGALVRWAKQFAAAYRARLHLVHVGQGEQSLELLRQMASNEGVEAECRILTGEVSGAVLEAVEQHGCELLVIGRGAERKFWGRFRGQAQRLIHNSPCAVFSV